MHIIDRLKELIYALVMNMKKQRKIILVLACFVVFITTYVLILPAFTLEKDKALEQGGIDIPANTVSSEVQDVDDSSDKEPVTTEETTATEEAVAKEETSERNKEREPEKTKVTDNKTEKTNAKDNDSLTFEGENYKVSVVDKNHVLPANTEIKVEEIDEQLDSKDYKKYISDSIKAVNDDEGTNSITDIKFARFYDIKLVSNGKEINTDNAVSVSIEYENEISKSMSVKDSDKIHVIHFAEDKKTGEIEPEILDSKNVDVNTDSKDHLTETTFEAEGFSVYAVIYTVDFSYSVDGESYEYSLEGDSSISLKELLKTLEVIKDDKNTEPDESALFMNEIDKVEFTDDELINIEKATGDEPDWTLTSLKPFDSEEKLTITMKNGDVFEVNVTDAQLKTYAISAKGEKYEIIVTYDETAEIPEDAELEVREITSDSEEYSENVELANKKIESKSESELITDPVQFDISIVSNGEKIEPKEGSTVKVEMQLVQSMFENDVTKESENASEETSSGEKAGSIMLNGQEITVDDSGSEKVTKCNIVHITDEGAVEFINDVDSTVDDDRIVMQFETDSFSDYMVQGSNMYNNVYNLPDVIYVGDVIYMQNAGDIWVTDIGRVVSETKHNNRDDYKVVEALTPGTFRMCHRNDWNNGNPVNNVKTIRVLPAREEQDLPHPRVLTEADGIVSNNSIGLKLNLFDYDLDGYLDDRFNNYDFGNNNPATSAFTSHGINNGHALKFWGSGITNGYHGSLNNYVEHGVTSIVERNLSGGYPKLSGYNETLAYLFDPSLNTTDRQVMQGSDGTNNIDGLFKKEGDYYVYDSNKNYAYYNPETKRFDVYETTYKQKLRGDGGEQASQEANKPIGFFPFHEYDENYDKYVNWNKTLNHHFGMSMSVDFSLPKDPKAVVDTNGNPIIFEFSGDDDLWVFIDGKLAMDIGGIHQPTSGKINFQDGTVEVNGQAQTGFDFSNLYDGKKHTLQVFYIERGGCDSNCMIKFNLTQYGDIHFDKVDKDNTSNKLAGAVFGIYKDSACTEPLMEQLKNRPSRAYVAESDANGRVQFSDIPLGTYYLKELHAPEGYPLDDTVHTVRVYVDEGTGEVRVAVTIDGVDVVNGVRILNEKPAPINLGLNKVWQNADEQNIDAPVGVTAKFEIKRIRTYEKYTEQQIEGQGRESSHLTVGWIHNNQTHVYKEYDLIAGSQATVSWGYVDGYEGSKDCVVNGNRVDKDYVSSNIVSESITMPASGGSATFYIIDDSENGEAIRSINVAGQQFYGNSGGGVIHTFETITEPDPDFSYSGDNVTNNQVTLPIGTDTWQYIFNNLPTFGRGSVAGVDHEVSFNYTYYLEEVSNTAPEGTTVIYKDLNGNVINSASDAETSISGTQEIVNRVPFGYLKIEKKVTYNGSDQDLTDEQKSKLAGDYKFKIYTDAQCSTGSAVQDPDAAPDAEDKDLIITITIGTDGQAVSSDAVKLLAGKYWIKEVESSNPVMFPVENPIEVTVTKDNTTSSPALSSITNNYDENNGPDKIVIDVEKKFQGLYDISQVPANFELHIQYKVGTQTKTVTLQNHMATGENGETINFTQDGFTWHWVVGDIDSEAKDFRIQESHYDEAAGADWQSATLNGTTITSTASDYHDLTVTAPEVTISEDIHTQRITSDSEYDRAFFLLDDDILLTALTAHQGSLVISKKPLNLLQRKAIEENWPGQGSIKKPATYFSIEEHPEGFTYDNKTIVFGEKDGKAVVKFTANASSNEAIFVATYDSHESLNIANLVNTYEEVPVTIDIIKVNVNDTSQKLSGAIFTLRQIADEPPVSPETHNSLLDGVNTDIGPTDDNGSVSVSGLTHGYYELTEKSAPQGYIMQEDLKVYFKISNGNVIWLEPGTGAPSTWEPKSTPDDMVTFHAATDTSNANFEIGNESGASLPNSGGIGTTIFYVLGSILVIGCGIYFVSRRRVQK